MHITTIELNTDKLKSVGKMSTNYIPTRFITFATQKKNPLTISELMFSFYISTKAKDTKELKPALRTIMTKIKNIKFCMMAMYRES